MPPTRYLNIRHAQSRPPPSPYGVLLPFPRAVAWRAVTQIAQTCPAAGPEASFPRAPESLCSPGTSVLWLRRKGWVVNNGGESGMCATWGQRKVVTLNLIEGGGRCVHTLCMHTMLVNMQKDGGGTEAH